MTALYNLDKVVADIDLKDVEYIIPEDRYYAQRTRYLRHGNESLTFHADQFSGSNVTVTIPRTTLIIEQIDSLRMLLVCTKKIMNTYGKVIEAEQKKEEAERERRRQEYEAEREKREAERAKEREEARKQAEIRSKLVKEREERLLNEFLGDTVRVRVRGYKSKVRAVVQSHEVRRFAHEESHWVPRLEYVADQNWHWPKDIDSVVSLEVRVGGRFETVWNDLADSKPSEPTYRGVR